MQDRVTRKGYAFYFCCLGRDLNPRLSPYHTTPPLTLTPPTPPRARVHLRNADARTGGGAKRRLCRIPRSGMRLVRARSPKAGLRTAAFGKVGDKSGELKAASVGDVRKPAAFSMPYRPLLTLTPPNPTARTRASAERRCTNGRRRFAPPLPHTAKRYAARARTLTKSRAANLQGESLL